MLVTQWFYYYYEFVNSARKLIFFNTFYTLSQKEQNRLKVLNEVYCYSLKDEAQSWRLKDWNMQKGRAISDPASLFYNWLSFEVYTHSFWSPLAMLESRAIHFSAPVSYHSCCIAGVTRFQTGAIYPFACIICYGDRWSIGGMVKDYRWTLI